MNVITRNFAFLGFAAMLVAASSVSADETFDALVKKLADDSYAVRVEAKKTLTKMCQEKPALLDQLAPVVFDEQDEIERVLLAREVVADAIFVERGAIGFALDNQLIVGRLVNKGPAAQAGIQAQWRLLSVSGKSVEGKSPDEIYIMVHAARPGTKLEMEFLNREGGKVICHPEVVERAAIRSDENSTERKKQLYEEWMERKGKELQAD